MNDVLQGSVAYSQTCSLGVAVPQYDIVFFMKTRYISTLAVSIRYATDEKKVFHVQPRPDVMVAKTRFASQTIQCKSGKLSG